MRKHLAIVSVSGGKDSTATALVAMDRMGLENCRFVFADTGNEHELTLDYVHNYMPTVFGPVTTLRADFTHRIAAKRVYIETKWAGKGVSDETIRTALGMMQPSGNPFLDLCIWKGRFPSRMAQFCTQELKRYPLDNYMMEMQAEGYELSSWRGIRRDESQNRRDAKDSEMSADGWMIEHPIASWSAEQTIAFVIERGVKLNPLYLLGMKRVGCMPCINCGKDELLAISQRFPDHVARIRAWEKIVRDASKRGAATFFHSAAEPGETIEAFRLRTGIDARIAWAETGRGGRQQDFIRQEPAAECASVYGLCE